MDLSKTIQPKSDQLNFDDFNWKEREYKTITITDVKVAVGGDQPVSIHYVGDNGKPWKPSKGMRRVLIMVWGTDGALYKGRQVTLFGDETIKFGGSAVGGIRISHMSHISQEVAIPIAVAKSKRISYTIHPIKDEVTPLKKAGEAAAINGLEPLRIWWESLGAPKQNMIGGAQYLAELKKIAEGK